MGAERRPSVAPEFATLDDRPGLEIVDHVEAVRFELRTPETVEPASVPTDPFPYPMDSAVEVRTDSIEIPKLADVLVRDPDGAFVTEYSTADDREVVPAGAYDLDLTTAPLKLHLLVESALEIYRTDRTSVVVDFDGTASVTVGARSFHERPAGTITITEDVTDLMDAVSLFGTALKTTSPERSFPTLRGHPPRIKLGDRFRVSKGIESPATGVRLVLPPERRLVYAVAPLSYYLGAEVVPGDHPRLETDDFEHAFPEPTGTLGWDREADDFERAVHRTFRQAFVLDCITRTEGLYPVDLHERRGFEERTDADLDFGDLYEMPLADRLEAYLDVPHVDVKPFLPTWNLLVDVVPAVEHDEALSYLVDDLALIRTTPPPEHRQLRPDDDLSIELHGRQEPTEPPNEGNPEVHDMSYAGKSFEPATTDAIEHAHLGDGYPRNSNKLSLAGFENQLTAPEAEGSPVKVHVVSNDPEIKDRGLLGAVYGDRNVLDIDVSYDYMVTTDELEAILHSPVHFLHFVGEATGEGLVCTDGVLDPRRVYDHGVQSFFVERCEHYGDLEWLVNRGAYGGIVTTTAFDDRDEALVIGRWMARLLNEGFTLCSAAEIANEAITETMDYVVTGDGGLSITQSKSQRPNRLKVDTTDDGYRLQIKTYPQQSKSMGGVYWPNLEEKKDYYLSPNELPSIKLSSSELLGFFQLQDTPVVIDGKYTWTDEPNIEKYL